MKKLSYLIVLVLILGLTLTGCLLSNVGQVPTTGQSGVAYLTKGGDPLPELVGQWHFDEGGGTTTSDSSGNPNDGTLKGGTDWTSGKFGNALSFDGDGDYVDFGSGVTDLIGGDYTVEAWIKPASLLSGRHVAVSFRYMELGHNAGKVYFRQCYDGSWPKGYIYESTEVLLDVTEFSHIVGVFRKDAGVELYVDGVYIGSDTTKTGTTLNIFSNTYAGVWYTAGGGWFDGIIDEVCIWDGALTPSQIAQSYAGLHVDDDGIQWPGAYETINEALAVAGDGDTIIVHEGTYTEQVVITTSNLMLMGVGDTKPVITVGPGATGAIVHVWGATDVSIVGFEIDGAENGFAGSPAGGGPAIDQRFYGIRYSNASGTVRNNEIHDIKHPVGYEGVQSGLGIYAYASNVSIFDNVVSEYQKNGITANLAGDSRIHGNTITGWGHTDLIAQNGIQVGYGAKATVKNNTVIDNWYDGDGWAATGILVFEADNNNVVRNVVDSNQGGVAIESWDWLQVSADNNKVTNNTITNSDIGVSIVAYYTGTADNNKVIHNTFTDNIDNILDYGTATKVHANVP